MAEKTVTLTHPDAEKSLTVPESEADKYTHGGWSVQGDKPSSTTTTNK